EDARPNQELMKKFGRTAAPLYVIVEPTADSYKEVSRYDKGLVIDSKKGTDDLKGFLDFLDRGLGKTAQPPLPAPPATPRAVRGQAPATADKIDFDVKVEPTAARRGEVVRLIITGRPREGYHTYPLTVRSPQQDPLQLSKLINPGSKDFKPLWPVKESEPEFVREGDGNILLEHKKPLTWTQEILVRPDATPGKAELPFSIKLQLCDDRGGTLAERRFSVPVAIKGGPPVGVPDSLLTRSEAKGQSIAVKEVPEELQGVDGKENGSGLWAFILQGIFWGAVS